MNRNEAIRYWSNPDKTMIKRSSSKQHQVYYNGVGAELLEGLHDVRSPKHVLDLAMCYGELKIIVDKTPAKTCINRFCKTHNICPTYRKLQYTFLGLDLLNVATDSSKRSFTPSSIKGD